MRREAYGSDFQQHDPDQLLSGLRIIVFTTNEPIAARLCSLLEGHNVRAEAAMVPADLEKHLRFPSAIDAVVTSTRFIAEVSRVSRHPLINYEVFVRDDQENGGGSNKPVYFEASLFLERVATVMSNVIERCK